MTMGCCTAIKILIILSLFLFVGKVSTDEFNRTAEGYPVGFLPNCVGSDKPAVIPDKLLNKLLFIVDARTEDGKLYRRRYTYSNAARKIPRDRYIDLKNKPTVVFVSGFVDAAIGPIHRIMGGAYNKLNYNVILLETNRFTTYIYTVAARVSRDVGRRAAEVLASMARYGLDPKRTELVGFSLGGQVISYIAKNYRQLTGVNFTKVVSIDPAGPCFRNLPPNDRIDASDADNVLVIHTNMDSYGIATPVGHVDFYVNGGEYQPSDIPVLPCLVICSHFRSFLLWVISLEHPNSFVAMKCNSVQEARDSSCYDNVPLTINTLGPNTNFSRPGIYYLTTDNKYPYFIGSKGLNKKYEVWSSHSAVDNKDDVPW